MLPSEDQETEHDIYLLFYEGEYQKVQERFREKQRSETLLKQLSLNRDNYQVISPASPSRRFITHCKELLTFQPYIVKFIKNCQRFSAAFRPALHKKTPVTGTGD